MQNSNRQLLTIVTEARLESYLITDIERLGARGYTITDARGKGGRGIRGGDWRPNQNIRVEIICSEQVAGDIATHIRQRYYDNYAMVMFRHSVEVLRPEKFGQ